MKKILIVLLFLISFANPSIKPHFQLIGNKRPATKSTEVRVLMAFPEKEDKYEVIGMMGDCSAVSEYSEFISVYKKVAAEHGANCIVVSKRKGTYQTAATGDVCVEATAIYLKPIQSNGSSEKCTEYLKEIYKLNKIIDSLENEIKKK